MRQPIITILFSFLIWSMSFIDHGIAQEDPQTMMSVGVVKNEKILKITLPIQTMVNLLHLNIYEAAMGDLSICKEDTVCLRHAQRIKDLKCAFDRCTDQGNRPINCFGELQKSLPKEKLDKLDSLVCPLLRSPSDKIKKEASDQQKDFNEEYLAESQAYLMAMNGSADQCENHIKEFFGAFGPKWTYKAYKALAGCRILSGKSTVAQEERNFYIWYGTQTKWQCANIINNDIRLSCYNSQLKAPRLTEDQSLTEVESLVNHLYLQSYSSASEAVCAENPQCLQSINRLKPWLCIAYVCNGKDNTRRPIDCFKGAGAYYPDVEPDKINNACNLLRLFDEKDRQTLTSYLSGVTNDDLIEYGAYLQAINRSAESCTNFIKRHIGEDQSTWTYRWYRALSGCNILGKELTVEQEEAGYYIWHVIGENFNCADITNDALKQACSTPDAVAPVVFDEK
ncbi:MAG: hypothetical protein JNN05_09255 [Candidatus Omnitrophica bacterium]|nr:hypothetical protein [Candidatus Omnitrophota bacterium]